MSLGFTWGVSLHSGRHAGGLRGFEFREFALE
jgi:hypothetical protein